MKAEKYFKSVFLIDKKLHDAIFDFFSFLEKLPLKHILKSFIKRQTNLKFKTRFYLNLQKKTFLALEIL